MQSCVVQCSTRFKIMAVGSISSSCLQWAAWDTENASSTTPHEARGELRWCPRSSVRAERRNWLRECPIEMASASGNPRKLIQLSRPKRGFTKLHWIPITNLSRHLDHWAAHFHSQLSWTPPTITSCSTCKLSMKKTRGSNDRSGKSKLPCDTKNTHKMAPPPHFSSTWSWI